MLIILPHQAKIFASSDDRDFLSAGHFLGLSVTLLELYLSDAYKRSEILETARFLGWNKAVHNVSYPDDRHPPNSP